MHRIHRRLSLLLAAALLSLGALGCLVKEDAAVLHPDRPVLILEARGKVRVAAWSEERGRLVDLGWVGAREFEGWTLVTYDWQEEGR